MPRRQDPFQSPDTDACALARALIRDARFGALAVLAPDTRAPSVTRVALGTDVEGAPVTLISTLAGHTGALQADPRCALLVGEPGDRGDPLTHPRLSLDCTARFIQRGTPVHDALRAHYLITHPKAKLYIDFADFSFVRFEVQRALLNGGFGKAYRLSAADLTGI